MQYATLSRSLWADYLTCICSWFSCIYCVEKDCLKFHIYSKKCRSTVWKDLLLLFSSCCGEWSNCLLIESSASQYDFSFLAIKEQAVLQLTTSFFLKFPEQQGVRLLSSWERARRPPARASVSFPGGAGRRGLSRSEQPVSPLAGPWISVGQGRWIRSRDRCLILDYISRTFSAWDNLDLCASPVLAVIAN